MKPEIVEFYPTEMHRDASQKTVAYFRESKGVEAILLVNSCARGKATKDSCLDIAVLVDPKTHKNRGNDLENKWQAYWRNESFFQKFRHSGKFSEIHAYVFDGVYSEDCFEWEGGPDPFEIEIGNTLAYSFPLHVNSERLDNLKKKWLPYYSEEVRTRRLKMIERYFFDHIDRIGPYVERGLYFQAFKRLHWAFEKLLQNLFIAKLVYPLCYDKWIEEQIVEFLELPEFFRKLPNLFEIANFQSHELVTKGSKLKELYKEYIIE